MDFNPAASSLGWGLTTLRHDQMTDSLEDGMDSNRQHAATSTIYSSAVGASCMLTCAVGR